MRTSVSDVNAKTGLKQMKNVFLNKVILVHSNISSISNKFERYLLLKKIQF